MFKRAMVLAFAMGLFPSIGFAQSPTSIIQRAEAVLAHATLQSPALTDWQRQYDAATSKKDSGKKKMLIGAAMSGLGVIMIGSSSTNVTDDCVDDFLEGKGCNPGGAARTLGLITTFGGSGVFVWGFLNFSEGNSEMSRLASTKPTARALPASISLSARQNLDVQVGTRSSLAYRVSW